MWPLTRGHTPIITNLLAVSKTLPKTLPKTMEHISINTWKLTIAEIVYNLTYYCIFYRIRFTFYIAFYSTLWYHDIMKFSNEIYITNFTGLTILNRLPTLLLNTLAKVRWWRYLSEPTYLKYSQKFVNLIYIKEV